MTENKRRYYSLCKRLLNEHHKLAVHPRKGCQVFVVRHLAQHGIALLGVDTQRVCEASIALLDSAFACAFEFGSGGGLGARDGGAEELAGTGKHDGRKAGLSLRTCSGGMAGLSTRVVGW